MRWRKGLTLLEVVVALSLLSGVLFTLGILIPRSVMHTRNKGFQVLAAQLAENIIEETRALDSAQVQDGTFDATPLLSSAGATPGPATFPAQARQFPPAPYPSTTVTVKADGTDLPMTYYFKVVVGPVTNRRSSGPAPPFLRTLSVTVVWNEGGPTPLQTFTATTELGP